MKKLRIGMVGAGNIANVHLNAYQTLDNVEIAAICDINAERLNETADLFNIEKRYATEAEMLANEQLDAADVCVWNCNHAKCTIDALDAGLHVLCEKPMAYSVKDNTCKVNRNDNLCIVVDCRLHFIVVHFKASAFAVNHNRLCAHMVDD